jgi:hypothetical protein
MKSPAMYKESQTPTGSTVDLFIPGSLKRVDDQQAKDAERYRWLREHPAFETEAFLSGLAPSQYDLMVDSHMKGAFDSRVFDAAMKEVK